MANKQLDIPEPLSSIGCQELLSEEYTHSGWVRKKAFINKLGAIRWPQVYMVLANGCIYYFNNDYSKAPHGKFSLYGYSSVKRDKSISVKQAPFPFRIEHSNPEFKTYIFATSSEKEMKEWMKYIKGQMVTANGQTAENYYYTYRKAGKIIKQAAEDDKSLTYQDIETDIYATGTFTPSTDYSAKFGVKLQNEDSDDDELQKVPAPPPRKPKKQGKEGVRDPRDRPPQPIPGQEAPPTYAAPKLPSRNKDKKTDPDKPEIPPRDQTHSSTLERETDPFGELQMEIKSAISKHNNEGKREHKKHRHHRHDNHVENQTSADGKERKTSKSSNKRQSEDPYMSMKYVDHTAIQRGRSEESEDGVEEGNEDGEESEEAAYWGSMWFNGEKTQANEIIRSLGEDGVFLVRPGENNANVLVVYAENIPRKYAIQEKEGEFYLKKDGPHEHSIEMLLYVYHTETLPTAEVMLTTPYKLHPKYKPVES